MKFKVLLSAQFVALAAVSLWANFAGDAGGSMASGHYEAMGGAAAVELLDEKLDIFLYKGYAHVRVKYLFRNTGGDTIVRGGFPCVVFKDFNKKDILEISGYFISSGGEKIKSTLHRGKEIGWLKAPDVGEGEQKPSIAWYISLVPFRAGEKKEITIEYVSRFQYELGSVSDTSDEHGNELFRYLLSPGSSWKGPIGSGVVSIVPVSADMRKVRIWPKNRFVEKEGALVWEFANLEPGGKDNIVIDYLVKTNARTFMEHDAEYGNSYFCVHHPVKKYYLVPSPAFVAAKSSSNLKGIYGARSAIDGNANTAWIEGKDDEGVGEHIDLTLRKAMFINEIGIVPGYAKSREIYYRNNRIAKLEVVLNGEKSIVADIPDHQYAPPGHPDRFHFIDVSRYGKSVKNIRLIIRGVHRGADNDTCIGDVTVRKLLGKRPDIDGARGTEPWNP